MVFDGKTFELLPILGVDSGSFTIQIILNDGYQDMTTPAYFKFILNESPKFDKNLEDQTV